MKAQTPTTQKFTLKQFETYTKLKSQALPGDIMLSSTNANIYSGLRTLLGVRFDHISVFLDSESILHISWPKIRVINSLQLIVGIREYKLVRPNFSEQERETFLNILRSNVDAKYDFKQLFKALTRSIQNQYFTTESINHISEWQSSEELKLQKTKVCTDLVFFALSVSSKTFRNLLQEKMKFLQHDKIGAFSTEDLNILVEQSQFFQPISEENLVTPFQFTQMIPESNYFDSIPKIALSLTDSFRGSKQKLKMWISSQKLQELFLMVEQFENIVMIFNLLSFLTLPSFEKVKDLITTVYPENKFTIELFYHTYQITRFYPEITKLKSLRKIVYHLFQMYLVINKHQKMIPIQNQTPMERIKQGLLKTKHPYLNIMKKIKPKL